MAKSSRKRRRSPVLAFLVFAAALSVTLLAAFKYLSLCDFNKPDEAEPILEAVAAISAGRDAAGLELFSSNVIMFDPDSGETIYAKHADDVIYPASLTKMMTALIAVENIPDLDAPFTMRHEDYAGLYEQNAAMAGFWEGETIPVRDLLYATLLPSGAEAATALARAAAGSTAACVEKMNLRAAELGMNNTHFVNVTGLHDDDHYTTVRDLSLLLSEAIKNPEFTEVFCSLYHTTTATSQHPQGINLTSTIVSRLKQLERERPPIIGNKTGYTDEAQLCLASVAEGGAIRRAVISIGAEGDGKSRPTHLEDAYLLYQKALPEG